MGRIRLALVAVLACLVVAGITAARWQSRPCSSNRFAMIGDSNVAGWNLGAGCPNLGVSGDSSIAMAKRFNPEGLNVPALVIWTTANDVHFDIDVGASRIKEIADRARRAGLAVVITTPIPIVDQSLLKPIGPKDQAAVNKQIRKLSDAVMALKKEGYNIADIRTALMNDDETPNRIFYIAEGDPPTYEHLNITGKSVAWRVIEPLLPGQK